MEAVAVTDLKEHKISINVENLNCRESSWIPSKYDPTPFNMRTADAKVIDTLRAGLLNVGHACTFTSILWRELYRTIHSTKHYQTTAHHVLLLIPHHNSHYQHHLVHHKNYVLEQYKAV